LDCHFVTDHLQAIITVLSLVNPFMCAAIFAQIETGRSLGAKMASATKVALAVFVILTVAALVGVKVLHLFGVSLDAFMVAGGGVLAWLGFSMLRGLPPAATTPNANPSLTPLILFAAGLGTITGVITLSVAHAKSGIPVTAGGRGHGHNCDVALDRARRSPRRKGRRRLRARHGYALHGTDRYRDGGSICADGHAIIRA
jgi:MarC family integral membrane protein